MIFYNTAILPKGFKASGIACGLKKSGKLDLALFYSQAKAVAAIMATTNKMPAAPVLVNARHFKIAKHFQAIIANSGNANAFTGKAGIAAAEKMCSVAASCLSVKKENILVASTGIIGKPLLVKKIESAAPALAAGLSYKGIPKAAKAIMTTDKFVKEAAVQFRINGKRITVCAVAKGAGMISPKMATMLVFIFTDAAISANLLKQALKVSVDESFNCITVDGCMSTNDTVICLANSAAGNPPIRSGKALSLFVNALSIVCTGLAKKIVRDGEGATKLIHIVVKGAKSHLDAKKIALNIANSNLFKTAMFASSPNVKGRIVAACGAAGVALKEQELKINFTPLDKKEVEVSIVAGKGRACAEVYTSDLTYEYIKINAEYN